MRTTEKLIAELRVCARRGCQVFADAAAAMALAVLLALPLGVISALRQYSLMDHAAMLFALIGVSMPNFWLGPMLLILFSLTLRWLPSPGQQVAGLADLVLPAITLGTALLGKLTRMTRAAVLDVMREDYVRTARAKGLPERVVVFKHVLRNALVPITTVAGLQFGAILTGAIVTEKVFARPGLGTLLLESIEKRNFDVVQGAVIVVAFVYVAVNLATDLLYAATDPRVRLEAVCALRDIDTLESANVALRALGQETDNYISFALELTVRYLRDKWLPAMQAGKPVFDGNPSRLAYALKEVGDPRAIAPLVEVIRKGGIAVDDLPQAVTTVTALGQAAELDAMLTLAIKKPDLLSAVAAGAANNTRVPSQTETVTEFLTSKASGTRVAAAQLCGTWKVRSAREKLLQLTEAKSLQLDEAASLCHALGSLGATADLQKLSSAGNSPKVRAAAIAAWAKSDANKASGPAVALLASLSDAATAEAEAVYNAFIGLREGVGGLTRALANGKLRRPIAIAGVTLAHASGRDLAPLIVNLNKAGGLQPLAQNLSLQERTKLLADAQKSGNAERGREIYHRKALLCSSCHLVDNRGGKLGPDLTTVGSYMTPESLLESLLNPSSSIKQGYETVLVTTKDQSLVAGLLQRKTGDSVLLRDTTGKITAIPNRNVAKIDVSPVSLMPPGLTSSLRRDEMVDLLKFLTSLGKKSP